ncbi:DUF4312 family protein [Paenibacillus larvae]|uniref:DUF4312 family protein n=1 Tax=Paenibacillus larvae subsp. larvae DSM 25430 TaxID=697284 RepID=V9WB16_9BACL|nr:DUF4312 family protein [Paenibacillus larvae]AHD06910.1 hypothetical protein ERIC2_c31600 [Paenibacillus larvae subsp. larvae DSM 25430]AVG13474.1 hypothetical protein ERICII_03156 [Paenibacillus larvae subsp. larvae DSM 25430]MDR5568548.1 DUF4312 family protein [Paenibacillus larvae]MDR5597168.1 DUF4312 family protein [Paenibacillus larvae]
MLREETLTLELHGKGNTKEQAFRQIFQQIQPAIKKQISEPPIWIEPLDMQVISAKESSCTERFMGFLFPRKKYTYEVQAKVTVRLCCIEMSKIVFDKEHEVLTPAQRVMKLR